MFDLIPKTNKNIIWDNPLIKTILLGINDENSILNKIKGQDFIPNIISIAIPIVKLVLPKGIIRINKNIEQVKNATLEYYISSNKSNNQQKTFKLIIDSNEIICNKIIKAGTINYEDPNGNNNITGLVNWYFKDDFSIYWSPLIGEIIDPNISYFAFQCNIPIVYTKRQIVK